MSSVSVDGGMSVDPRENNYDSSESDSDRVDVEASVITHTHVRLCSTVKIIRSLKAQLAPPTQATSLLPELAELRTI